ncbi:hypothetical protein KL86PLE_90647 [uncultured Pleomorphomonas sp.]|uniref:Uncharacterized protein n=1 Tax=uncultured Pleomorphomonas sp. TaxID=442121 RepID=A0A212LQK9_9HYPH|nr:hypothetical protein [uncultured Pleomorphomonas sp.]SCM79802.1 hypothetical protein KL86PLE_90647 [uncultured Pleomorphomonas sp.]
MTIPDDIMKAAKAAPRQGTTTEIIARAIQAERERCKDIANNVRRQCVPDGAGDAAARTIASRIRSGDQPNIAVTSEVLDEIEAMANAGVPWNDMAGWPYKLLTLVARVRTLEAENAETNTGLEALQRVAAAAASARLKALKEVSKWHDQQAAAAKARRATMEGLERDLELLDQKIHERSAEHVRFLANIGADTERK